MDRRLIVVARDQLVLCDYLRGQFSGDRDVEVILDRRWGERRQQIQAHEPERRRADRQQGPPGAADLHTHGFVVIRRRPEPIGLGEIEEPLGELHRQVSANPPDDPVRGVRDQISMQSQSLGMIPRMSKATPSNGNGIWIGRPNGPTRCLVSKDWSLTPPATAFEEGAQEWREVLKAIGLEGLRFPENGALCAPWRKFLNDLRAATVLGTSDSTSGLIASVGSAQGAARRRTGVEKQTRMAVEVAASETQHPGTNGSKERVKIQAVSPGTRSDTVQYLFIVSRDQPEVYDRLTRDFAWDKAVQVILDRRVGERRQRAQGTGPERRRACRRRHPEGWTVPVSQLYRGNRPCFVPVAQAPICPSPTRQANGSSFFARPKAPRNLEDTATRARSAGTNGREMAAAFPVTS